MSKLPISPISNEGPSSGLPTSPGLPTAPKPILPIGDPSRPPTVPPVIITPTVTPTFIPEESEEVALEPSDTHTPEHVSAPETVINEDGGHENERSQYQNTEEYEEYRRQEKISNLSLEDNAAAVKLLQLIASDESSEVFLNAPDEITFKSSGKRFRADITFTTIEAYHDVIDALILYYTDTEERIETTKDFIEGLLELPDADETLPPVHARVTIIAPPAKKAAVVAIAKKSKESYRIEDLLKRGSMTPEIAEFLRAIAKGKITTVFSGVSGSGKTTMLEALAHEFDTSDRIILIEDTPELRIPVSDLVTLVSSPRKPGQDPNDLITLEWLVMQANRLRQDRIIVGEIRGAEMGEFLQAASSGSDGSMTTIHALSPRAAIDRMVSMTMKGVTRNENSILRDIAASVQIIIQLAIVDGKQVLTDVTEVTNIVSKEGGVVLQPIFKYDLSTGKHLVVGRPTDNLRNFLGQRGVNLNFNIFNRTGI